MPSPCPWAFVVKKDSKSRSRVSWLIPHPVSETVSRTPRSSTEVAVLIALNERGIDQDCVEEVVEIMGHSRGHLADGFEASGRDELVLGAPQIVVRAPQVIRIASALDGHG